MASYPDIEQLYGSTNDEDDGTIIERSVNGTPRLRTYYTSTRRTFKIIHDLSEADKDTLLTFYTTNKIINFTFTWAGDATAYTCKFIKRIVITPIPGFRFKVIAEFVES